MCVSTQQLVFLVLLALLAAGCFNPSATGDIGALDSGQDQAVFDSLILDAPRTEGLKSDGPLTDLLLKDSGPDAAVCPASKTIWDQFKWDEGCLWQ